MSIRKVGIVGCGLMGSGIAEVFARHGAEVHVHEVSDEALKHGERRIVHSLDRAVIAGKLSSIDRDDTLAQISYGTDLCALAHVDICIEAATEDETTKLELFRRLDAVLEKPEVILASNTSSVPIMKLATVTRRASQVIGMHFFNPVPVLPLVELVPSLMTSHETKSAVEALALDLDKTVIWSKDRAGFIVNALLVPFLLSAVRMLENGFASRDDIDAGLVHGCAHPMGPLRLCDLIGIDTVAAIAESLYLEFKEPLYAPPPLLLRMRDANVLGRKAGRGFYSYSQ
jgi:3-hydroxybutyryl-CoA dehydrogenase